MKVLHLCPLWHPISPDAPGGIETLLAKLPAQLAKLGCQVTLLAAAGSHAPGAEILPVMPDSLVAGFDSGAVWETVYHEQHQLRLALDRAADFDLLHSHAGSPAYVLSFIHELRGRVLHTHHNPIYRDMEWFVRQNPEMWFSTVSEFQAKKLWAQRARHCHVIHNGISVDDYTFRPRGEGGLLFLGRMERGKGPDLAISVARELRLPLTLAGPIIDEPYFTEFVAPFLSDQVRHVGVVNHRQKDELYGRAACVVLPFRHEEGFGMVTVEAMACGTPVVALANGAAGEIVEDGLTGYTTKDQTALGQLVARAMGLDRAAVRQRVAERFGLSVVARKYVELYERMLAEAPGRGRQGVSLAL